MSEAKSSLRLIIVLLSVVLSAGISATVQYFDSAHEAGLFNCSGRVLVKSQSGEYMGGDIETLESEELSRRAISWARTLHGRTLTGLFTVRARQVNDESVFIVTASGSDRQSTQLFLNALLDLFVASRTTDNESEAVVQEYASPAAPGLPDWEFPVAVGATSGGVAGLAAGLLLAFSLVRPSAADSSTASSDVTSTPDQSPPASPPASRSCRRFLIWGITAGAVLGALAAILREAAMPQEFRSLAKVVAARGFSPQQIKTHQVNDDYYGTIIETLESDGLRVLAMKRLRAIEPELLHHEVAIRVSQTKGSAIFNVLATSNEPKYTKMFLDALLDAFITLRTSQVLAAGMAPLQDVAILERATPASENIVKWEGTIFFGLRIGAAAGALLGLLRWRLVVRRSNEIPQD